MPQIKTSYKPVQDGTNPSAADPEGAPSDALDQSRPPYWLLAIVLALILGLVVAALVIIIRLDHRIEELEQEGKLPKTINAENPGPMSALKLVGTKTLTVSKPEGPQAAPVLQPIKHWVDQVDQGLVAIVDSTMFSIRTPGLYKIYAQLSWRTKQGRLIYEILKNDGYHGLRPLSTLAQCISSFTQSYAQQKTCYTSVTVPLDAGDTVSISVQRDDFTIDFEDGRSFFGIIGPFR